MEDALIAYMEWFYKKISIPIEKWLARQSGFVKGTVKGLAYVIAFLLLVICAISGSIYKAFAK
mgnify:CR=1 FL=1